MQVVAEEGEERDPCRKGRRVIEDSRKKSIYSGARQLRIHAQRNGALLQQEGSEISADPSCLQVSKTEADFKTK